MTPAELLAKLKAGTPGEWWRTHVYAGEEVIRVDRKNEGPATIGGFSDPTDAALIVALRNAGEALAELWIETEKLFPFLPSVLQDSTRGMAVRKALDALAKLGEP